MENKQPSFLELLLEAHIGLERQGPGSPQTMRQALQFLGDLGQIKTVADLGCGTGGQTLLLAEQLSGNIVGLDLFPDFTEVLNRKAASRQFGHRVKGVTGDMADLPFQKDSFDLIWSEGAIDNIGFEKGLRHWHDFLKPGGYLSVTCPSWLTKERPEEVEQFWTQAGSRLDSIEKNLAVMQDCGYQFVAAFVLPETCWTENYYAPREQAIQTLLLKYDFCDTVKAYAEQNRREVELYDTYHRHYGYVFYIGRAMEKK